jgi:hypothetical protein
MNSIKKSYNTITIYIYNYTVLNYKSVNIQKRWKKAIDFNQTLLSSSGLYSK